MTSSKIIILSGVWTLFVLTPFAISIAILKTEVRWVVLALFLIYFLRRCTNGRVLEPLKYLLFAGILFSALTSLIYRIFIFIKFGCLQMGCESSQYLSILASVTSIGTILFLCLFVLRERVYGALIRLAIPKLIDSAGMVVLLIHVIFYFVPWEF